MSDLQVVLPYKELLELLEASKQVKILSAQLAALLESQAALRSQFLELMEKYRELKDYVTD